MGIHDEKVALITGAAKGIGYAAAESLLEEGAIVCISDIVEDELMEAVKALKEKYGQDKATGVVIDVSNEEQVNAGVQAIVNKYGKIDYLVNNAGITGPLKPIHEYTFEEYKRIIEVDQYGVFLCTKAVVPHMPEKTSAIVNIASSVALVGTYNACGYVSSKHAVAGLTKSTAFDLADKGIRANGIAPGVIRTKLMEDAAADIADGDVEKGLQMYAGRNPMGRVGEPEEVGHLVSFLLSEKASYINADTIKLEGGQINLF